MTAKTDIPAEAAEPERSMPTNVIAALSRVTADLPGIGKDQKADPRQGGYAYRGIEDITRQVQPLFARYGVVVAPRVLSYEVIDIVVNEKPWTDTRLLMAYTVYGPGGSEDSIEVGPFLAIGRDQSDKGGNKCASQAFKYLLLQLLCISDAADDADGTTHEADSGTVPKTTRRVAPRRANVPDGQETAPARWEQKDAANASTDDVATMGAREVAEALRAAGLEAAGSLPQMRLRLQEHRSGVGGAKPAAQANGKTAPAQAAREASDDPNLATEKQLGFVNSLFAGYEDEERYAAIGDIIGREIASSKKLTKREASQVIEVMKSDADA